jgi:antitoxin YefM
MSIFTTAMPIQTTYTAARANLAKLCDEVTENQRIVIISRKGRRDVALISADELSGLLETLHLLRSPKNAARLLTALDRAKSRKLKAKSVTTLRKEVGLGQKN